MQKLKELDIKSLVFPSSKVIIVQSRLLAPSYAGSGRWMMVNTSSRKAYLATGSDGIPGVLQVLDVAKNGITIEELSQKNPSLSSQQIKQMIKNELLVPSLETSEPFWKLYHNYSYNYPFQDYSDPLWREKDQRLMEAFAKVSNPPALYTEYKGTRISLPLGNQPINEVAKQIDLAQTSLATRLSFVLKFTFGTIGYVESNFMTCLHRTSPSGGARHPTDAYIAILRDMDDIASGYYAYDAQNHSLVKVKDISVLQDVDNDIVAKVSIRSKIERSMWRYREVRAYRPILLDAGHIIETLVQAAGMCGLYAFASLPNTSDIDIDEWFEQPDLQEVVIRKDSATKTQVECHESKYEALYKAGIGGITNPFLYLSISEGNMTAYMDWPKPNFMTLNASDMAILSHCTPSLRGDRDTSLEGIQKAFPDVTIERIEQMSNKGLLINEELAVKAYKTARSWAKYGWYISLLKYVASRSYFCTGQFLKYCCQSDSQILNIENIDTIISRRTCRSFSEKNIQLKVLSELVSVVGAYEGLSILIAAFSVEGLLSHIYSWDHENGFIDKGILCDREAIAGATIGQYPSSSGAVTIWLLSDLELSSNAIDYDTAIISLGRAAQRICMVASLYNLGVFLTPALSEPKTFKILDLANDSKRYVPYLLSIGYKQA